MKKAKVWDLAVRLFHWGVGALVAVAFLTSEEDETIPVHIRVGLLVLGAVVFRVAWGIWGTPYARFRAFVRAPREVLAYAREYIRGRPPLHVSHNPLGAVMVIALLATLLGTTLTGIVTYAGPEWGGALASSLSKREAHAIKELHEALAGLLLVLVGIHVAGVVASSILERQNLVLGMITGRKRVEGTAAPQGSRLRSVVGLLGAAFVAYGAVRVVLFLLPVSTAEAATPAPVPVGVEATYREECGSCHLAYPPGLLPRASWSATLNGLADHFGQNAELDDATRQELAAWLEANAAESNSHRKSAKVLRSLGGAAPLRLTEVPYLRRKHREVRPSTFSRKSIGSRANCPACHETADRWDFNEDWVSIPKL